MDIRENVKIRSLRAKFIRHVVLVSVQRMSGLLLSDLVNTTTHIQDTTRLEVTYQGSFVRLAPIVRFFSLPPNFGRVYE